MMNRTNVLAVKVCMSSGPPLDVHVRERNDELARRLILQPNSMTVVIGRPARDEKMVELAASVALRGPVDVLDAGNGFSAFEAARYVRRRTPRSAEVLGRIRVARAFTCYQVLALLRATPSTPQPKIVLGLLSTFRDENVAIEESRRVLEAAVGELYRLKREAAVAVSVAHLPQPSRRCLLDYLAGAADQVQCEEVAHAAPQARLF
jgi:hypothetical protein